jgi:hypothetical protein
MTEERVAKNYSRAYLPEGMAAALPRYTVRAFTLAARDFVAEMARGDRSEYRSANYEYHERRYGRVHMTNVPELIVGEPYRGPARPRVWALVRHHLLCEGFIETEPSLTSPASYRVGTHKGDSEAKSICYRLTQRWRQAPVCECVDTEGTLPTEDTRQTVSQATGDVIATPTWYVHCLNTLMYDMEGAVCYLLARAGAETSLRSYSALVSAIKTGTPPTSAVAAAALERRADEKRTDAQVVTDSVLGQLSHIWRWRFDRWSARHAGPAFRDCRGHRLHSGVTSLASELRRFMSFDGEPMWSIDAANSQMVLLAGAASHDNPHAADLRDFAAVCAAGRFYEESFRVVHAVDRDPTPAERQRWKAGSMGSFLYATWGVQTNSRAANRIAERWPTLHTWMLSQKEWGNSGLPCRMQAREATIWVDRLAPELEARGIRGVTAHDSLFFPASARSEVEAIVRELYRSAGLEATFVIKPLSGEGA